MSISSKQPIKQKLLLCTLIVLTGCGSIKYAENNRKYWRPVNDNVFTYKKRGFHLNGNIIDTTKIYCHAYPADTPTYFDCYRFFANGRLLTYEFVGHIDTAAFADINFGGVGYYHIRDHTIWVQEFTVYGEHFKVGGGGRLIHHYGTIADDHIALDVTAVFSKRYFFKPKLKGILSPKEASYTKYQKTTIAAPGLKTTW